MGLVAVDQPATLVLIGIPIVVMFLTSLPPLLFLGESERYLNGTLMVYPAVIANGLHQNVNSYAILILYGVSFGLLDLLARSRVRRDDKISGDNTDILIRMLPEGSKVLCSNLFLLDGSRALISGRLKWIYPGFWPRKHQEKFRQFELIYPRLNYEAIADAAREYNADAVLLEDEDSQDTYFAASLLSAAGWDFSRKVALDNTVVHIFLRRS